MAVLLIAEHDNASLKDATHKALTAALAIDKDVHVLVAGKGADAAAKEASGLSGVKKVLHCDSPMLERPLAEPMAALVVSMAGGYSHIVAPATTWPAHSGTAIRLSTWSTMTIETGRMAKQAAGAVLVTYGETAVLVTATRERVTARRSYELALAVGAPERVTKRLVEVGLRADRQ